MKSDTKPLNLAKCAVAYYIIVSGLNWILHQRLIFSLFTGFYFWSQFPISGYQRIFLFFKRTIVKLILVCNFLPRVLYIISVFMLWMTRIAETDQSSGTDEHITNPTVRICTTLYHTTRFALRHAPWDPSFRILYEISKYLFLYLK